MTFNAYQFINLNFGGGPATPAEIAQLNAVLVYLQESPLATSIIAKYINTHSPIYYLSEEDYHKDPELNDTAYKQTSANTNYYYPPTDTKYFYNTQGRTNWIATGAVGFELTTSGSEKGVDSAALSLLHEMVHATTLLNQAYSDVKLPGWDTLAEKVTIQETNEVAAQLGEVLRGPSHFGAFLFGLNPTEHVDANTNSWQEQSPDGKVTVTGGIYDPAEYAPDGSNALPILASYDNSPNSATFSTSEVDALNNETIEIASGMNLTVDGNGESIFEDPGNTLVTLNGSYPQAFPGSSTDTLYFGYNPAGKNVSGHSPVEINGVTTIAPTAPTAGVLQWSDGKISYTYTQATQTMVVTNLSGGGSYIINNFSLQAAETVGFENIRLSAPQAIGLSAGANITPPALAGAAPATVSVSTSGAEETFTINLLSPAILGETLTLAAIGSGVSTSVLSEGSGQLSLASGSISLNIPVGQDSATFTVIDPTNSTQAQTVNLTATLNGSGLQSAPVSNSLSVTFNGTPTAPAGTVITGITGTLPNVPAANAPIVSATYYQLNNNNDVVTAGSGSNIIADSILGYEGLDGSGGTSFAIGNGIVPDPYGYAGAVFTGAAGNDTISGGGGSGVIAVGNGNNQIFAGTATSLSAAMSQAQSATASGTNGYYIAAGDGNNTIVGGTGNDYVEVGEGNNTLVLGPGSDTFIGGMEIQGNYLNWTSTGSSTIFGGSGNDQILGGGGNDYIDSESGNDSIVGEGGNSTIYGGTGNDTIYSGDNNATWASSITTNNSYLDAGSGNTLLYGAGGNDTLMGGSGNDSLYGGNGNEDIEAGSGTTSMGGGSGNDTLIGGGGADSIFGGSGTDVITAGDGNDSIFGGAGTETIVGGAGTDFITAGNGNVTITGGSGRMIITGGSGNDSITTGDGGTDAAPDQVTAGSGNTTIVGGAGVNNLFGGAGNDVIYAGDGGDAGQQTYVTAGAGNNTIYGGNGWDDLNAGAGADVIYAGNGGTATEATFINGGTGTATIYGGAGDAQVSLGGGSDTVITGTGNMSIIGGSGTGTYEISSGSGQVNIYSPGAGDTLEFGAGISIADISAQTANFPGNISGIALTLNGGGQVAIEQGGLSQVSFAGGTTVTFAQLLSPQFTIGNTTYSSTSGSLTNIPTQSTHSESVGHVLTGASAATTENLTLMGSADLSVSGNNVDNVLTANAGNDTLITGTADDTLIGGGASDDYIVSAGTGTVTTIQNSTAADTLSLASGISLSDLSISTADDANGNLDVTIQVANGGQIVIDGTLNSTVNGGDGSSAVVGGTVTTLRAMASNDEFFELRSGCFCG